MSNVDDTYETLIQSMAEKDNDNTTLDSTNDEDASDQTPEQAEEDSSDDKSNIDDEGILEDIQDADEDESDHSKQNSAFAAMRHTIQDLKRQLADQQALNGGAPVSQNMPTSFGVNNNMVFDPDLEKYVPADSFEGVLALRALAAKQREIQRQEMVKAQEFTKRLEREGRKYKNFDESVAALASIETDGIRAGLLNVERPESVINYLGRHPDAFQKLASLKDTEQAVYIGGLHERLKRPAKVASSAPDPIRGLEKGGINAENFNPETATSEQIMRYLKGT